MKILGIETSCDDTGLALVEATGTAQAPKFKVLKNLVSSQIKIHRPFGGVVPNLAKREHIKNLPLLWQRIMNDELRIKGKKKSIIHNSQFIIPKIDAIAVTVGPGLEPALWAGINFAEQLHSSLTNADFTQTHAEKKLQRLSASRPRKSAPTLVGVNHMEGHLYSFLLGKKSSRSIIRNSKFIIPFPAVALVVSGGHTILLEMKDLTHWKKLGETRDDAAGEAFDKVARLLGLPYPGGPEIEKLAKRGNPKAIEFPRPMLYDKNFDFSFSGLKTAVLYHVRGQNSQTHADPAQTNAEKSLRRSASSQRKSALADVAASFQQAALDVLIIKTTRAAEVAGARSVILCGGVAANKPLRKALGNATKKIGAQFFVPDFEFNNDNAAMIAAAGYMSMLRKKNLPMRARGDLSI